MVTETVGDRLIVAAPTPIRDDESLDLDAFALMVDSDIASPVVELGRYAGWSPLPLSVRDARRAARDLRARLQATVGHHRPVGRRCPADAGSTVALSARGVLVRYPGDVLAVAGVDLDLHSGEVTAVMGRNGCGKSSLLWALQGSGILTSGTVRAARPAAESGSGATASGMVEPRTLAAGERRSLVGMVPQTAADLLYLDTVGAECAQVAPQSPLMPADDGLDLVTDRRLVGGRRVGRGRRRVRGGSVHGRLIPRRRSAVVAILRNPPRRCRADLSRTA